jgi:hypothetical protein
MVMQRFLAVLVPSFRKGFLCAFGGRQIHKRPFKARHSVSLAAICNRVCTGVTK